jgi:hypothetical protein
MLAHWCRPIMAAARMNRGVEAVRGAIGVSESGVGRPGEESRLSSMPFTLLVPRFA